MAKQTKTTAPASVARPGRARPPARPPASAPVSPAGAQPPVPAAKPNLLQAGLKALGNVRDDVAQHRSRFFETILGIEPGARRPGAGKPEKFEEQPGQRKFEAVFDQRVASALERMGMPSAEALQALADEVSALRAELTELKGKPARARAAAKATTRKR